MKRITQILKRIAAFLVDLNIIVFIFNLFVLFIIFIMSKKYGDFVSLLHSVENNPQYFFSVVFIFIFLLLIVYLVILPNVIKNTIGLKVFGFKIIPENNINFVNLFLKFITGFLVDLLLFFINIYYILTGKNVISSYISDLNIEELESSKPFNIFVGILIFLSLIIFNIYFYYTNLPFKLGKQLTNYEKLLDYATINKDSNLLQKFLKEYDENKNKNLDKINFYTCILSILRKNINLTVCKQIEKSISIYSTSNQKIFWGYVGDYYFAKSEFNNASKYLEYFYNNRIFNDYYWKYLLCLKNIDSKVLISKLNKQIDNILKSNNDTLIYNVSLLYIENQDFGHAIKLLQKLKESKPETIDYANILWYLGKAQFLSKKYNDAIENMKQAAKLNPIKYMLLFKSYESYYKTQITK